MKLFIYYGIIDEPWGGSNSFLKAFKKYIENKKRDSIKIVKDINEDYDIFLMNTGSKGRGKPIDLREIENIKRHGSTSLINVFFSRQSKKKIVFRLDGLRAIYNNKYDPMDSLQIKASKLADHIIFQSNDCLNSFKKFGYNGTNYSIISNGVDQTIFNLNRKKFWNKEDKLKIFSCSWSSNPRKGYSTIAAFSTNKNIEMYFAGNWPDEIDKKNVIFMPPMKQEELAGYYKNCDIFLHAAKNDPCPNVVLEALSCGLPILYHNSGGTVELSAKYGIPLPEVITNEHITVALENMKKNYDYFIQRIKEDIKKFSIEYAAEKYIAVFYKVAIDYESKK